jgi:hypothetical protein
MLSEIGCATDFDLESGANYTPNAIDCPIRIQYRIFLDGKNVMELKDYPDWSTKEDMDFYAEELMVKDVYLGSYILSPGRHTLRFESAGKNALSKGRLLGMDSIRLRERWQKKRKSLRPANE